MKMKMKLIAALKIRIIIYPSVTLFFYLLGKPLSVIDYYISSMDSVCWFAFGGFIIGLISPKMIKIIQGECKERFKLSSGSEFTGQSGFAVTTLGLPFLLPGFQNIIE